LDDLRGVYGQLSEHSEFMSDLGGNELERMERALQTVDAGRRAALRNLVVGAVFVAPVVASFAIDGLTVGPAYAQTLLNSTISGKTPG
jgi:hypothetical protein